MKAIITGSLILMVMIGGCGPRLSNKSTVQEELWGESNEKVVKLFTLTNKNGVVIKVTNYGATLTYVSVPDKNGVFENVVLGFDSLKNYQENLSPRGKTIGRFANRIRGAQFTLNGTTYPLTANNGMNTIHGGAKGFSSQVFEVDTTYSTEDSSVVSMHYTSADLEEGFPGNLTLYLNYVLTGENEIKLEYKAETDKPTVVNFTNHSFFNLTGTGDAISDHVVKIIADSITPLNSEQLPIGFLAPVAGTSFDFIQSHKIKDKLESTDRGYNMNYKLRKNGNELALAAVVSDSENGRLLEAYTTEPGMQLYTTNNAICLEMQHFPDSPNKPNFPTTVLNPEELYRQVTVYKFSLLRN